MGSGTVEPWNTSGTTGVTGHYTQVIWAKTTKVGCGYVQGRASKGGYEYVMTKLKVVHFGMTTSHIYCLYFSISSATMVHLAILIMVKKMYTPLGLLEQIAKVVPVQMDCVFKL